MHDLVGIAIIAGLLALDDRAGWQSLAGEPVFSALVVGLCFGHVAAALHCGLALQLVWLSIGAARGARRPNTVLGGVVGAGTACLSLHHTGDPRESLVIAGAVFCGLAAGEAGQWLDTRAGTAREKWLERFRLPQDANVATRNLVVYTVGSALYIAVVSGVLAALMLPGSLALADVIVDRAGTAAAGATLWLAALPAIAVATIAHAFATRTLGRMAAVGGLLAVVVAWLL
ncbi:MAG TPA: PTS sugar transporter subunit IIC [Candidatus Krumholzibacteria bacterium]|nr:PTS sugar transporter subunit IIC [Candidatus Krumholzibacteria bacterium]